MINRVKVSTILVALVCGFAGAHAQQAPPAPPQPPPSVDLGLKLELEPQAIALLKAMSDRLTAAKTISFDMIALYESPARTGQPLAYTTISHVTLQRPDKLRVITPADGPPSEFYYNGKQIMAYSPDDDMVAMADAPPTIEAALKQAFQQAAIYYPFTDLVLPDPYKAIADGLKLAFVIGQSKVIGNTTTDIIALANENVHAQLWIGAEDKLPRMFRATFFNEPGNYRHEAVFSNWHLDEPVPADAFWSTKAAGGKRIPFEAPETHLKSQADKQGKQP
jgi:hypothetical protein